MTFLHVAYLLIAVGMLLMLAELLVPSGFFFVVAILAVIGGVAMTFIYADDPLTGWVTLAVVFVVIPLIGRLLLRLWPRTPIGKRMFLQGPQTDDTVASMPVNLELEQFRGRVGRAVSALRPSGIVEFDGRRIDSITEGMMVEAGQWVRCIDVRTGKVIVRPVEKPNLGDLEAADLR